MYIISIISSLFLIIALSLHPLLLALTNAAQLPSTAISCHRLAPWVATDTIGKLSHSGSAFNSISNYTSSSDCRFIINPANLTNTSAIRLSFLYLDVECGYDYVHVYNGLASFPAETNVELRQSVPMVGRLCGTRKLNGSEGIFKDVFVGDPGVPMSLRFISDTSANGHGFVVQYEVIDLNNTCTTDSDCHDHGACVSDTCVCDDGYTGVFCHEPTMPTLPTFTPRMLHSATYDPDLDVMYVFGGCSVDYTPITSSSRFLKYDFATETWQSLSTTSGPSPRYDHLAYYWNNKLYIWGGHTKAYDISEVNSTSQSQLFAYSTTTQTWSVVTMKGKPSLAQGQYSSAIDVFSQNEESFYIMGGSYRISNSFGRRISSFENAIYRYTFATNEWSTSSYFDFAEAHPQGYYGGYGLFQPSTRTAHSFFGYDGIQSSNVYGLSFSTLTRIPNVYNNTRGLFKRADFRTGVTVHYFNNDWALIVGGEDIDVGTCYHSTVRVLDLHCLEWRDIENPWLLNEVNSKRRAFHASVIRNNSLILVGGFNGKVLGDMQTINLSNTSLTADTERKQCRADVCKQAAYDCHDCSRLEFCRFCDGVCVPKQEFESEVKSYGSCSNICEAGEPTVLPLTMQFNGTIPAQQAQKIKTYIPTLSFFGEQYYRAMEVELDTYDMGVWFDEISNANDKQKRATLTVKLLSPLEATATSTIRVNMASETLAIFEKSERKPGRVAYEVRNDEILSDMNAIFFMTPIDYRYFPYPEFMSFTTFAILVLITLSASISMGYVLQKLKQRLINERIRRAELEQGGVAARVTTAAFYEVRVTLPHDKQDAGMIYITAAEEESNKQKGNDKDKEKGKEKADDQGGIELQKLIVKTKAILDYDHFHEQPLAMESVADPSAYYGGGANGLGGASTQYPPREDAYLQAASYLILLPEAEEELALMAASREQNNGEVGEDVAIAVPSSQIGTVICNGVVDTR